jgi:muconolactone D-isomerase
MTIKFQFPDTMSAETRKSLDAEEIKAVRVLADKGHFLRAWRVPGRREMWTLWKAKDADELHATLAALPFWPYLDLTVHPLAKHHVDPSPPADE